MLVHYVPETAMVWEVGHTLKDDLRRPIHERAINDVAVPRDPADVGGAPEHFAWLIVKDVMEGRRRPNPISTCCVQHAFGLAG